MKQPKPKLCPCGIKFTPRGIQKYHSVQCELKHKTGKVESEDLINLPLQVLRDMALGAFQKWVVMRDGKCYTYGRESGVLHGGHFFKKQIFSGMIFNEVSTRCQCDYCNVGLDGNIKVFEQKLIAELGIEKFIVLENESITTKFKRWSKLEFIEKFKEYTHANNNVYHPINVVK